MLASTARSSCTIGITSFRREAHRRTLGLSGREGKDGGSAFGGMSGHEAPGVLAGAARPAGGWEIAPPVGSESRRELPFQGRGKGKEGRQSLIVGTPRLSECLPQVNLACLKLSLPDGGRRVLLGASRPTEHPLPTPAGNPAGSRPTRTSLWPGQFLGKTDACHKPLGKRHPALALREPPALGSGLQSVLFPGEELRANGALGQAEAVKGRAVARKAAFRS